MSVKTATMACLCAMLVAACGGSGTTTTSVVPISTSGTVPTTSAGSTTATTSANGGGGPPACRTADFAFGFLGQEGATGHGEVGFALRNTSGHECHTYGYPGILLLDRSGAALPTRATHTTIDFFGNTTEAELVVAPGASVSFRLGVSHGAASASGCTTAYGLQVIAPDDTVTARTTIPQGIYECGGRATLSPLQAADTAFTH